MFGANTANKFIDKVKNLFINVRNVLAVLFLAIFFI